MNNLEFSSLCQLTMVRFRLFLREPEAIFWIFIFPILLAAASASPSAIVPPDVLQVGATTLQLTHALATDKGLTVHTMDEADRHAGPRHRTASSSSPFSRPDGVVYQYDDTNPDARTARLLADRAIQTAAGRHDAAPTKESARPRNRLPLHRLRRPRPSRNEPHGLRHLGHGIRHRRRRQKKLLKRLVASPMPRWQYLASFLLSRLVMLVIEVVVFLGFARLVFGVPFRGSICSSLYSASLPHWPSLQSACSSASRAKTIEAVSGLMNLVMFPMWIFSGVFFSSTRFPAVVQPLIRALPLTAAINAMRGNMLQGMSLQHLLAPVAILLAWLIIPFAISLRIFRWR